MPIYLGIDPGFHFTGYALIKKGPRRTYLIDAGYLKMNPKKHLSERIKIFYDYISNLISEHKADYIALETPFLGRNAQTFLKLGYLRGILYLLAAQNNLKLIELSPTKVKADIAGTGRASKEEVATAVMTLFPGLKRIQVSERNDVTDAVAICLCGIRNNKLN